MAIIERTLGRHRDWPQLESATVAALLAGTANDPTTETIITTVPDMTLRFPPTGRGQAVGGTLASNRMVMAQALFVPAATASVSGNSTNYADLRVNFWRNGVFQGTLAYYSLRVTTTLGTSVTPGTVTVTPASMTGIVASTSLGIGTIGTATFEVVCVQTVTATTFTALYSYAHIVSDTVASVLVPYLPITFTQPNSPTTTSATSITIGSVVVTPANIYGIHVGDLLTVSGGVGSSEQVKVTAITPTTFTATFTATHTGAYAITGSSTQPPVLQAGDTVTMTRLSNNATGIATPAGILEIEWLPAGINA